MRVTKSQLRRIIREERQKLLRESYTESGTYSPDQGLNRLAGVVQTIADQGARLMDFAGVLDSPAYGYTAKTNSAMGVYFIEVIAGPNIEQSYSIANAKDVDVEPSDVTVGPYVIGTM